MTKRNVTTTKPDNPVAIPDNPKAKKARTTDEYEQMLFEMLKDII